MIATLTQEMQQGFENLNKKSDELVVQVGDLRTRTTENSAKVALLSLDTKGLKTDVGNLQAQVGDLRVEVKGKIDKATEEIIEVVNSLADYTAPVVERVEKLENRVDDLEKSLMN